MGTNDTPSVDDIIVGKWRGRQWIACSLRYFQLLLFPPFSNRPLAIPITQIP